MRLLFLINASQVHRQPNWYAPQPAIICPESHTVVAADDMLVCSKADLFLVTDRLSATEDELNLLLTGISSAATVVS